MLRDLLTLCQFPDLGLAYPHVLRRILKDPYQRKWFDMRNSARARPRLLNELQPENCAPFGTRLAGSSLRSANLAAFDLGLTKVRIFTSRLRASSAPFLPIADDELGRVFSHGTRPTEEPMTEIGAEIWKTPKDFTTAAYSIL